MKKNQMDLLVLQKYLNFNKFTKQQIPALHRTCSDSSTIQTNNNEYDTFQVSFCSLLKSSALVLQTSLRTHCGDYTG